MIATNNAANDRNEELRNKVGRFAIELGYLAHLLAIDDGRLHTGANSLIALDAAINIGLDSLSKHLPQSPSSLLVEEGDTADDWESLRVDLSGAPDVEAYLQRLSQEFLTANLPIECLAKAVCSLAGDIGLLRLSENVIYQGFTMTTTTTTASQIDATTHQRRLRRAVKQLVTELGYLEHCLAAGIQDLNLQIATNNLDIAIDRINDHLSS